MSLVITSENIIRMVIAAFLCPALLYGADRAIVFHAAMFRAQLSRDKSERLFNERPKVITTGTKLASLLLTTVAFCVVVLTDGDSTAAIAISIGGFLTFIGLSLFETIRALENLQEGR